MFPRAEAMLMYRWITVIKDHVYVYVLYALTTVLLDLFAFGVSGFGSGELPCFAWC